MVDKQSIQGRKTVYDLQQYPRRGRAAMELDSPEDLSEEQRQALSFYRDLFVAAKNGAENPLVGSLCTESLERYIETISRVQAGEWPEDCERRDLRRFFAEILAKLRERYRAH